MACPSNHGVIHARFLIGTLHTLPTKAGDFKYVVLSGRFCHSKHLDLYEQAYKFWFESWREVFKQLKADRGPRADDFFRQDFVPVILHRNRVVGIHHASLYDLRSPSSLQHSYLHHNFNASYFDEIIQRGIQKAMSFESLFVAADYRKTNLGIQMGEILIALGQHVFVHYTDADAIIAPARADIKVSHTACALGFERIQSDVPLNNVSVDLLICRKEKVVPPVSEESKSFVNHLWSSQDSGSVRSWLKAA